MTSRRPNDDKKAPAPSPAGPPKPKTTFNDDYAEESESRRVRHAPAFAPRTDPAMRPRFDSKPTEPSVSIRKPEPKLESKQLVIAPRGWTFTDVPTLPEFYPLERTACFVPNIPKDRASIVSTRVSNVIRELSIEATYDDTKAKAKCMTAENVDFRVRLYRGRNQYSHGIIVEVQRRFGFAPNFHQQTMAILDAAEGKVPFIPPSVTGLPEISDSEDEYDATLPSSSLAFVSKMLSHPSQDARALGLKTLSSVTNPIKMGRTASKNISTAFLEPGNDVGTKVVAIVENDEVDPDETFGLRLMAMTALANGIQAVSGDISESLWDRLRPIFVKILLTASDNPQMAYLAARSIEFHILQDPDPIELGSILKSAHSVGQSCHADLNREADRCLKKLESR